MDVSSFAIRASIMRVWQKRLPRYLEKRMKKIYIKWEDSRMYHGWKDESDLQHIMEMPLTIESMGWMIHENDQRIVLAGNLSAHSENFGNPIVIPKSAILERRKVKVNGK